MIERAPLFFDQVPRADRDAVVPSFLLVFLYKIEKKGHPAVPKQLLVLL